ncbi:prepilin-type N-terminal cleavage/methylation domain-containing protein [Patescibacteria group bacterium]|nr:prepilin-type N-terminal cleavage/methylation domain-containing protein [Patescibacteria group bacterium]
MLKYLNVKVKKGFTLLEVTIAIFILLVGVTAGSVLIARTVSQMSVFSSKLIAAYLTQEGIEIIRNIRDTNWLQGGAWDEGLTGCFFTGCEADYTATTVENPPGATAYFETFANNFLKIDISGFYNYTSGTDTKYKRKITIVSGADILTVTVETTWSEKGKDYSHIAQEILYNWK